MSVSSAEQRGFEARESREIKEGRESEGDEALKKAAAMERAEYLVREVQSNRKQMQHIIMNMLAVQKAIIALRAQLLLAEDSTDAASVTQDKTRVARLKALIVGHKEELIAMRDDLIREQVHMLQEKKLSVSAEELTQQARVMVDTLLATVDE